jgi:hypothetical protein
MIHSIGSPSSMGGSRGWAKLNQIFLPLNPSTPHKAESEVSNARGVASGGWQPDGRRGCELCACDSEDPASLVQRLAISPHDAYATGPLLAHAPLAGVAHHSTAAST